MRYFFDDYGWLCETGPDDRTTNVDPQFSGDRDVGKPYPNCLGQNLGWVLADYVEPVIDSRPQQRAALLAQLVEIDAKSVAPRAQREAALGQTAYLLLLNAQANELRTELAKL